jgi:hypothetical protein
MHREMTEYPCIAGRQFGRDAIRRREMFGDPFVRIDLGFGRNSAPPSAKAGMAAGVAKRLPRHPFTVSSLWNRAHAT